MDDLHGSPSARLRQLETAEASGEASTEWLARNLRRALEELDTIEPIADAAVEGRQDY